MILSTSRKRCHRVKSYTCSGSRSKTPNGDPNRIYPSLMHCTLHTAKCFPLKRVLNFNKRLKTSPKLRVNCQWQKNEDPCNWLRLIIVSLFACEIIDIYCYIYMYIIYMLNVCCLCMHSTAHICIHIFVSVSRKFLVSNKKRQVFISLRIKKRSFNVFFGSE